MSDKQETTANGGLFAALVAARGAMKAPKKTSKNPFFKNTYAALDEIVEVSASTLAANGLMVVQSPRMIDGSMVLHTQIIHSSGESLDCGFYALAAGKGTVQDMGSSITYARRYALASILGLAAEEDDDGAGASKPSDKKEWERPPVKPAPAAPAPAAPAPAAPPVNPRLAEARAKCLAIYESAPEVLKDRLGEIAERMPGGERGATPELIADAMIAQLKAHGMLLSNLNVGMFTAAVCGLEG